MDKIEKKEELFADLIKLVDITINEEVLLKSISKYFYPKPKPLANTKEEAAKLELKVSELSKKLGGPPNFFIRLESEPTPVHDTYCEAAISEAINAFDRAYDTICRAHMYSIAKNMFLKYSDRLYESVKKDHRNILEELLADRFWENAEIGFIRLASYWDRVGQLFDFIFFNIRQYERDGFPNVFDRIKVNYIPIFNEISSNESWNKLNDYQKSEQINGLKWLLKRRNLLIHSLYLRDSSQVGEGEEELFISSFNHLEETIKKKLKPGSMDQELKNLHTHLEVASTLFPHVLFICSLGVDIKKKM